MDETFCTRAIILNRKSFRENDSSVVVYSIDLGKINLVVRGARKTASKLAAHIEPINLSEIMVIRGKQYNYLGAVKNEDCFLNIKNDLEKLRIASEAIGLFIERVKENQKDEELFFLLKDFLDFLNISGELRVAGYVSLAFQLKLLKVLGYCPEIDNCVLCKKSIKDDFCFDYSKGGLICRACYKKDYLGLTMLTISKNSINMLKLMLGNSFNEIAKNSMENISSFQETKTILRKLYEYQT